MLLPPPDLALVVRFEEVLQPPASWDPPSPGQAQVGGSRKSKNQGDSA